MVRTRPFNRRHLHENVGLSVLRSAPVYWADIHRRMRPRGLGEVFNHARDAGVTFDEKHIARLNRTFQRCEVGWRGGLIAGNFLGQVAGDALAKPTENDISHEHPALKRVERSARSLIYPNGLQPDHMGTDVFHLTL